MSGLHWRVLTSIAAAASLAWCGAAFALNPALDLSQYIHTSWKVRDGFAAGRIFALAQTADGYLWLGTTGGLYRFDGVRTDGWRLPVGQTLPAGRILALLAAPDGSLWIGAESGLARWNSGKLTRYRQLDGLVVAGITAARDGTVLAVGAQGARGTLCAFPRTGAAHCDRAAEAWEGMGHLTIDRDGALWISDTRHLWRRSGRLVQVYESPSWIRGWMASTGNNSAVLVSNAAGLVSITDGKAAPFRPQGVVPDLNPGPLFRDHGGGLWIGTLGRGLVHVSGGGVDHFGPSDGLSGGYVNAFLEDREGNVWVATNDGLDQFRDPVIATYTQRQGLSSSTVRAVLEARDGSLWLTTDDEVDRWKDGRLTVFRPAGGVATATGRSSSGAASNASGPLPVREVRAPELPGGFSDSLFEDSAGRLWVSTERGLAHFQNERFVSVPGVPYDLAHIFAEDSRGLWMAGRGLVRLAGDRVETAASLWPGRDEYATAFVAEPRNLGQWLGFRSDGVGFFQDGRVRQSFTTRDGLGGGRVGQLQLDPDGTLWAATEGGLSRIKDGRVTTLSRRNGLPCDPVLWMLRDDDRAYWLYTSCGLFRLSPADMQAWIANPGHSVGFRAYDAAEGLRILPDYPAGGALPRAVKGRDGRIWFAAFDGLSVIDPRRLPSNTLPPPVRVEQVTADDKTYDTGHGLRLPPLTRHVVIDYTALSFVAPERMRFRYKLEGLDRTWREVINKREAEYTNLPPGDYRFQVIAANNSGVWNTRGATLNFSIAPAYWQTKWFLALCAAAFTLLLSALYWLHERQVAREAAREEAAECRQRELQAELTHANRLVTMGQLAASISHEIRQPITSLMTSSAAGRRWADQGDLDEVRRTFDTMRKAAVRATEIIDGLRVLAKKAPPRMVEFDMNEAIREVMVLTRGEAAKTGVAIDLQLVDDLPRVRGDRVQLQQVILNLVVNAIEAMGGMRDGPRDLLVRTARAEPAGVSVLVQDSGPGLDAESASRIFEFFYTTKSQGLGMGLSICRSIVEAHGGTLTFTPSTRRGAAFQFTLPGDGELDTGM
jgi:signal transduction histidine kinase/ligand-binding sensor domain-containing protein